MRGYTMHQDDYRRRLARIEGQVRGLARMIEEDQYCIDVLDPDRVGDQSLAKRRPRPPG